MTKAQEECNRFEVLSEQIVQYIFKNTDATINRTDTNKDGGGMISLLNAMMGTGRERSILNVS